LSDLIELWSSNTATQAIKESALAHFKEDLEGAALNWADNRAKLKKYAAIGKELAEFEEALKETQVCGSKYRIFDAATVSLNSTPSRAV